MAADPSDARTKRRKAMGDDPNKMSVAPQPIPGAPQTQNHVMNNPKVGESFGAQMGSMSGVNKYLYDEDIDAETQLKMGAVGFAPNSGIPQNIVPGQKWNESFAYNTQEQPNAEQQAMMEPMYEIAQADGLTMPGGPQKLFGVDQMPPYQSTPMGPTGTPTVTPGAVPPELQYGMPDNLPMQGGGMNTGRGGGRNKGKN